MAFNTFVQFTIDSKTNTFPSNTKNALTITKVLSSGENWTEKGLNNGEENLSRH